MISRVSVQLGSKIIQVPMSVLKGNKEGKTLLITAGNDGDEYAGIQAAYRIIEQYSYTPFSGTLKVIPIVNIPGFEQEKSQNPLDNIYPKHIYPGNEYGHPSERMRFWLSKQVECSDFWMDLHGGSLVERLIPFAWSWKSGNTDIDTTVASMIAKFPVKYSVMNKPIDFSKHLARNGCGYLLTESGAGGLNNEESIALHISMIHIVMNTLNMIDGNFPNQKKQLFERVDEYTIQKQGIWNASFPLDSKVKKGNSLGEVRSLDGKILHTVKVNHDGILLWGKVGMRANIGDVVAGVGVI